MLPGGIKDPEVLARQEQEPGESTDENKKGLNRMKYLNKSVTITTYNVCNIQHTLNGQTDNLHCCVFQ